MLAHALLISTHASIKLPTSIRFPSLVTIRSLQHGQVKVLLLLPLGHRHDPRWRLHLFLCRSVRHSQTESPRNIRACNER